MEALPISPVTASHQTAKPHGTPQGPRGLGDIFAALLQEATIRLDARPADLASFETRWTSGEPPRKASAAESISSVDNESRRDDAGFRADNVESDADVTRDRVEPLAPVRHDARDNAKVTDDGEFAVRAPEDTTEPDSTTADEEASGPADDDIQLAEGDAAEVAAPVVQDDSDPALEEIAAPATLPVQAQQMAAAAALGAAQSVVAGEAAVAALTRAATQSQVPAHAAPQAQAASTTIPAAAGQFGTEVGATRVQVTPASVVAQPNAALGGGAAVAALAAETGQANAQNGAQNSAQNSQAGLPNAASQTAVSAIAAGQNQVKPGNPGSLIGTAANSQAPAGDTANTTQGATASQNGNGAAHAAQNAVTAVAAAPATGFQGQGQSAPSPTAGEPGNPNPQNARTPFADSNNQKAGNSGAPNGLSAGAQASEAGAQNRLAQNARTGTAQTLNAPVPGTDGPANAEGSQQPSTPRTATESTQAARPAALDSNQNSTSQNTTPQNSTSQNSTPQNPTPQNSTPQNSTPQTARNETAAQPGVTVQAATQNAMAGTATAAERAMAPASVQRAEGAGPANANNPWTAGTLGLTQAAIRTPQTLPAQARPATAASLPANQVAVNIQRAVAAGQDRIRISLHPAELGKIDVKLSLSNDGAVKAVVSIERPETFELLQRDARGLEKALQDAGLKTDSGSLSFNLKGEEEQNTAANREDRETGSRNDGTDTPDAAELAPEILAAANANGTERALDLHV